MDSKKKKYLIIAGILFVLWCIGKLSSTDNSVSSKASPEDESVFMREERSSVSDTYTNLSQKIIGDTLRGDKPEQSHKDGSVQIVKDYIEENAKYPRSIRYKEWSKVTDFGEFWVVRCKFKGKNSLGNITDNDMWFYIQNGQVVKMSTK